MKKRFTFMKTLLVAVGLGMGASAWADTGAAVVKMTYVNYSDADTSYGEIAAGSTAEAGCNKLTGTSPSQTVDFYNTSWGVNYITYLQVDASAIPGTITGATLTFEGSGSRPSGGTRTSVYGVGYNSSTWSSSMTYNTADRSITTIGSTWTTKVNTSAAFEEVSFSIYDALKDDADKIVTIIVYETAADHSYIKNPAVEITYTTESTYAVTFAEMNGVAATVKIDGSDVTSGTSLPNGTYDFTATAAGYKDYAGSFTVAGAAKNVEFTMTAKSIYSYTVKGVDGSSNDLGAVNSGSAYEDETVTYYYPQFVLSGTTLYKKNQNGGNPYFGVSGTLDADNKEFTVTYGDAVIDNVVFYAEAENISGFAAKTTNNATIRCSNGTGGIVDGSDPVKLTTLPAGKYKIFGQVWGTTGLTAGVTANDKVVWSKASTGSLAQETSSEFNLIASTDLYIYTTGGNDNHMLDLIYIQRTGDATTEESVTVGSAGMATYVPAYDLDFSATGIKAYKAKVNTKGVCTLTEVANVPAGTPVLLIKDGGATESIPVMTDAAAVSDNDLVAGNATTATAGVATSETIEEVDYTNMILNNIGGNVGFYFAAGQTVAANRAYLHILTTLAPDKADGSRMTMVFGDDTTTGINAVESAKSIDGIYNLNGQRVAQPTKGLYIVNGKKVVVK